jgi:hypothetical protein
MSGSKLSSQPSSGILTASLMRTVFETIVEV